MGLNIGKPTGSCENGCGTLVRYVDMTGDNIESYQACPDCDDV